MDNKFEKLIAITNRHLAEGDYFRQIEKIVRLNPKALIIREKDLSKTDYKALAEKILEISEKNHTPCFVHSHTDIAKEINCKRIHFSIPKLKENINNLEYFDEISVSCHSIEDVKKAIDCGATQVIVGNIFETDCKKGLAGKGLEFLKSICEISSVPVYGIGGISLDNLADVLSTGARGGCMMSGFMRL